MFDKIKKLFNPTQEKSKLTQEKEEELYRLLCLQITPQTGYRNMECRRKELNNFIDDNKNILTKSQYRALQNKASEILDDIERIEKQMHNHPYWKVILPREAGTPNVYTAAIRKWKFFVDYYKIFCIEEGWDSGIPALETIMDIAPKINDKPIIEMVLSDIEAMSLERYNIENIKLILSTGDIIESFRKKHIGDEPVRQVDLVKPFDEIMSPLNGIYRDVKWCVYVWKMFDIVHVEKKGRYNFVTAK